MNKKCLEWDIKILKYMAHLMSVNIKWNSLEYGWNINWKKFNMSWHVKISRSYLNGIIIDMATIYQCSTVASLNNSLIYFKCYLASCLFTFYCKPLRQAFPTISNQYICQQLLHNLLVYVDGLSLRSKCVK